MRVWVGVWVRGMSRPVFCNLPLMAIQDWDTGQGTPDVSGQPPLGAGSEHPVLADLRRALRQGAAPRRTIRDLRP